VTAIIQLLLWRDRKVAGRMKSESNDSLNGGKCVDNGLQLDGSVGDDEKKVVRAFSQKVKLNA
jgi:hypothetical protein